MQCRRIFGERTLSTSSRNVWSLSWILKVKEGWGEIDISTKGVVDRREEAGGEGKENFSPFPTHPIPAHFYRNQT